MKTIVERVSSIYEVEHVDIPEIYNFIVSNLATPTEIIEEFDFGICQIGMTTNGEVFITDAFLDDFNNKTLTIVNHRPGERKEKRISRMKEKFPDWEFKE